jgi:hypothetical protein
VKPGWVRQGDEYSFSAKGPVRLLKVQSGEAGLGSS